MTLKSLFTALALALAFTAPAQAQAPSDTLKKIAGKRAIALGYRVDAAPFSFLGPDGMPSGFTVELCKRVVAGLERQLKLSGLTVTDAANANLLAPVDIDFLDATQYTINGTGPFPYTPGQTARTTVGAWCWTARPPRATASAWARQAPIPATTATRSCCRTWTTPACSTAAR